MLKREVSGWREVAGTEPKEVLGLILFNTFIKNLDTKRSVLIKFADDTKLGGIVNNKEGL